MTLLISWMKCSRSGIVKRQTTTAENDKTRYQEDLDKLKIRYEALLSVHTPIAVMDALVSNYNSTRTSLQGSLMQCYRCTAKINI